jgi:hypothetical protein
MTPPSRVKEKTLTGVFSNKILEGREMSREISIPQSASAKGAPTFKTRLSIAQSFRRKSMKSYREM